MINPIVRLDLAVRTNASNGHLHAFLSHHLKVCSKAFVLIDCRPNESPESVIELLKHFGDRVSYLRHNNNIFHNGLTCNALSRMIEERSDADIILHLDKDEFVSDLNGIQKSVERIRDGSSDYAQGEMICRFAPGGKLYSDLYNSFLDFCEAAPVRTKLLHHYGFPSSKCFLTRNPHIKIHKGLPNWKKDPHMHSLEHFRWIEELEKRTSVKLPQHSSGTASKIHWRDRNVREYTEDFKKRLRDAFYPQSWQIPDSIDHGDLFKMLGEKIPGSGTFVELGVWQGRSLSFFCEYTALLGKKISAFGYDQFDSDGYHRASRPGMPSHESLISVRDRLNFNCPWNKPLLRMSDLSHAAQFHPDKSVDIVWVNAGHDSQSVVTCIKSWMPKMKDDGTIAGNDMNHEQVRIELEKAGIPLTTFYKSNGYLVFTKNGRTNEIAV